MIPKKELFQSKVLRLTISLFFVSSGAFMSFAALGGWGYWSLFFPLLWVFCGFVWLFRPAVAARLGLFPVLAISALLIRLFVWGEHWPSGPDQILWLYGLEAACVLVALVVDLVAIWKTQATTLMPLAISFSLVASALLVQLAFTDRTQVRSYSMNWSADGKVPWGEVDFDKENGPPVVIYRKYGDGYCFDEFYSSELKRRLADQNKPLVTVEYDVTTDFGRERGYNVRSVDGLLFALHDREVRPGHAIGGFALVGSGSGSCEHK